MFVGGNMTLTRVDHILTLGTTFLHPLLFQKRHRRRFDDQGPVSAVAPDSATA
jgi:hypothetical protein